MALLGDRVQETTATAGTGTFALGGAVTGYVTFNSTFTNGDIVWYVCDDGAGNWEIGTGTVGTGTLTRTPFQSSNSNNLVSFLAGTKRIFCSAPYTYLLPNQTGNNGKVLTTDGSTPSWTTPASGTVTAVSVATANGLAGTSSGGATPQLTLSTSVTGMLKGNGTAISAAVAGTDYAGLASANTFTDNQIISVNSSSDALRITQTGAGNALVVEDSANPDASPFVINTTGQVVIGNTVAPVGQLCVSRISADASSNIIAIAKERNGAIVQSGDNLGQLGFYGYDGASYLSSANITAAVDGTPGTNDMPGRLVFSTTADGASSPTERMRIDSAGQVGIGGASTAGVNFRLAKSLTGSTNAYVVQALGTVQADVTGAAWGMLSQLNTAAASFTTLTRLFQASQGTIGAGSTLSSQTGFFADASLTGATSNYGFYSSIASGTGRWNFYAAGTAANYFAGTVTANAVIESTSGGFKFPDGTTQTSAGVSTGKAIAMAMIFGY